MSGAKCAADAGVCQREPRPAGARPSALRTPHPTTIVAAAPWSRSHLFTSPDVSLRPSRRGQPVKDTLEEAERWVAPQKKYIAKDVATIGALGARVAASPLRRSRERRPAPARSPCLPLSQASSTASRRSTRT